MEKEVFELNSSQDVTYMQCRYSFDQRVMNILASLDKPVDTDFDVMEKAIHLLVKRHDCLRIYFYKEKKKIYQYFIEENKDIIINRYVFNNNEEFDAFLDKYRKIPIKWLKQNTFEFNLIKLDNKVKILLKIAHAIADVSGINNLFFDLNDLYNALKNNTELPKERPQFKDTLDVDLANKNNSERTMEDEKYFHQYFSTHEEPYYASLGGDMDKKWQKIYKKGKRAKPFSLFRNNTTPSLYPIDKEHCDLINQAALNHHTFPSTMACYIMALTASLLNNKVPYIMPIELCNCRATLKEKGCGGTKVQTIPTYCQFDYTKTLKDNIDFYIKDHDEMFRHISYDDVKLQSLFHSYFKTSLLTTYYDFSFSYIATKSIVDGNIEFYSNLKGALICYSWFMYNIDTKEGNIMYEYQNHELNKKMLDRYHATLLKVIEYLANEDILLDNIEVL